MELIKKEGAGQKAQRHNTYNHRISFLHATVKGEKLWIRALAVLFRLSVALMAAVATAALVFPAAWAERGCTDAVGGEYLLAIAAGGLAWWLSGREREE